MKKLNIEEIPSPKEMGAMDEDLFRFSYELAASTEKGNCPSNQNMQSDQLYGYEERGKELIGISAKNSLEIKAIITAVLNIDELRGRLLLNFILRYFALKKLLSEAPNDKDRFLFGDTDIVNRLDVVPEVLNIAASAKLSSDGLFMPEDFF